LVRVTKRIGLTFRNALMAWSRKASATPTAFAQGSFVATVRLTEEAVHRFTEPSGG
jgi:hypothetical protein